MDRVQLVIRLCKLLVCLDGDVRSLWMGMEFIWQCKQDLVAVPELTRTSSPGVCPGNWGSMGFQDCQDDRRGKISFPSRPAPVCAGSWFQPGGEPGTDGFTGWMMIKINERLARILLVGLLLGLSLAVVWARFTHTGLADGPVEIRAVMPESGGWSPDLIRMETGQRLHIRFTSDDVVHGFAVGKKDWPSVDIFPGQWSETTLVFDRPGKYTYYCTRWCGPNHWRMRGVIEVEGPGFEEPAIEPLYVKLGIDIDAPHLAEVLPEQKPSARRGLALNVLVPLRYQTEDFYRANSPEQIWKELRAEASFSELSDQQVWDLVAVVWTQQVAPEKLKLYETYYADNCAACHGASGEGNGVLAPLPTPTSDQALSSEHPLIGEDTAHEAPSPTLEMGHAVGVMPDFKDPAQILGASPALLQGKIIRGGMGTGMPYFGPILTEEQTWALVAYIQSFQFDME
jgi:mono/diheme cytochrome c family protein/plastocyanin